MPSEEREDEGDLAPTRSDRAVASDGDLERSPASSDVGSEQATVPHAADRPADAPEFASADRERQP